MNKAFQLLICLPECFLWACSCVRLKLLSTMHAILFLETSPHRPQDSLSLQGCMFALSEGGMSFSETNVRVNPVEALSFYCHHIVAIFLCLSLWAVDKMCAVRFLRILPLMQINCMVCSEHHRVQNILLKERMSKANMFTPWDGNQKLKLIFIPLIKRQL